MENLKDGNRRLRSSYVSAIISISLVLFLIGLLGLLILEARRLSDYVREHVQVSLFLQDNLKDEQVKGFLQALEAMPEVRSASYVSKEAALDSLKRELGEEATGMLEANPLPSTIDLNVRADYTDPDSLRALQAQLQARTELVREVVYQQTEVERINRNFRTVALVVLAFSLLLLVVAIALINNTIRLTLFSRRFTIKSMQLVGATRGFIRRPFLLRSLLHGIYATLIACILLSGLYALLNMRVPELAGLLDIPTLGILYGGVAVLGMMISGISTFFAVNRYLRLHLDELYY
jgi:cell division transport system permease protein